MSQPTSERDPNRPDPAARDGLREQRERVDAPGGVRRDRAEAATTTVMPAVPGDTRPRPDTAPDRDTTQDRDARTDRDGAPAREGSLTTDTDRHGPITAPTPPSGRHGTTPDGAVLDGPATTTTSTGSPTTGATTTGATAARASGTAGAAPSSAAWSQLQTQFVDDPAGAVRGAVELVEEAVRESLKHQDDPDTEGLRTAFLRFRDLHRVLTVH